MADIISTTSYIRKRPPDGGSAADPRRKGAAERLQMQTAAAEKIWALLETPQTIESLCRVLVKEQRVDPAPCREHTRFFLESLLDEDLVEVSPDS